MHINVSGVPFFPTFKKKDTSSHVLRGIKIVQGAICPDPHTVLRMNWVPHRHVTSSSIPTMWYLPAFFYKIPIPWKLDQERGGMGLHHLNIPWKCDQQ